MSKREETPREDMPGDEISAADILAERNSLLAEKSAAEEKIKSLVEENARARADFYNYRTRVERDRDRDRKLAAEQAIAELLPVLENLERVCDSVDKESQVYKGITMVAAQFSSVLYGLGLELICTDGEFDPNMHEAVVMEPVDDESQDGLIIGTLRKGYRLAGRVIRAAQVRVGKF